MGALMERFAARAANIVCTQTIHGTSSIRPPPVNKRIHQPASVKEIFLAHKPVYFGTEFADRPCAVYRPAHPPPESLNRAPAPGVACSARVS